MMLTLIRFALLITAGLVHVQSRAAEATETTIGSARHLSSVLLGLMAIIALIFILAWFYRKASGGSWLRSGAIRIVAASALGTRERLLLVEVGGTQMLLGVTAQNITRLHVFDEPVVSANDTQATSSFNEKLQTFMTGRGAQPTADNAGDLHTSQSTGKP